MGDELTRTRFHRQKLRALITSLILFTALFLAAFICCTGAVWADFTPAQIESMRSMRVEPPLVSPTMKAHSTIGYALAFAHNFYVAVMLIIILQSGILPKLHLRISKHFKNGFLQILFYMFGFRLATRILNLPFAFYSSYYFPHSFGLSEQSLASWFGDWVKQFALDVVVYSICFWIIFEIVKRFHKHWILILWGALSILIAVMIFIDPILFEPLFNKFTPMPPGQMRTAIQSIAAKAGIPDAPILVVDKSKQTKTINAYVTGLGSSARIVIWDNTLERLPEDQVLSVVAHETGHYALGHIYWGFLIASGGVLVLLLLVDKIEKPIIARLPKRWEVHSITDLNAIPVIILAATIVQFLISPLDNGISRIMEHQADAFGLQLTGNGPAMARTFVSLSEQNLSDPDPPPLVRFWLFSHPTLKQRIAFCLGWTHEN